VLFPLPTRATDILHPTAQDSPHVRPRKGRLDDDAPNRDFFKRCQACHDHLLPKTPQPTQLENYTGPPDCNTRLQVCNPSVMSEDVTDYTFSGRQAQHGLMPSRKRARLAGWWRHWRERYSRGIRQKDARRTPVRQSSACRIMPWTSQG